MPLIIQVIICLLWKILLGEKFTGIQMEDTNICVIKTDLHIFISNVTTCWEYLMTAIKNKSERHI